MFRQTHDIRPPCARRASAKTLARRRESYSKPPRRRTRAVAKVASSALDTVSESCLVSSYSGNSANFTHPSRFTTHESAELAKFTKGLTSQRLPFTNKP